MEGDQIQCGKIKFDIVFKADDGLEERVSERTKALKDFDVAAFLEAEDEAERSRVYGNKTERNSRPNFTASESRCLSTTATSINLVEGDEEAKKVLEAARKRANGASESETLNELRARRLARIRERIEAEKRSTDRDQEIKRALTKMLARKSDLHSARPPQ